MSTNELLPPGPAEAPTPADRKLIHQANQIAAYFEAYPAPRAAQGVEHHIRRYWDPRIRLRLAELPDEPLHPLVRQAAASLRRDAENGN